MQPIQVREQAPIDGQPVQVFTLANDAGTEVRLTNFGGIVTHLFLPDAAGAAADVVLGFDDVSRYVDEHPYFGALIGRVANRIGGARYELDGEVVTLSANDGVNQLHGGTRGFDKKVWAAETHASGGEAGVRLRYRSPDGEEGFPGNLDVEVLIALTDAGVLRFDMHAATDRATPVNLTHHGYWNFAGQAAGSILDHELQLFGGRYTVESPELVPNGMIAPVTGTPLDFTAVKAIGRDIGQLPPDGANPGGYDHNVVLEGAIGTLRPAARVRDPGSGRGMEVWTTQPGVQFYSGNFLDGSVAGKGGAAYAQHDGLCLEPQHFPDAVNHPGFPSCILRPGKTYAHTIEHRFFAA